jgi:hypothetical protein
MRVLVDRSFCFFRREIFEFSRQKDFETLRQLEETLII